MTTLNERLERIVNDAKTKRVIDRLSLMTILKDVCFEPRLIEEFENAENLEEILEEFLNQSEIWVDDDSGKGQVKWLSRLLETVEDNDRLLHLCSELDKSLVTDTGAPLRRSISLPQGMYEEISKLFEISGWIKAKQFLDALGTYLQAPKIFKYNFNSFHFLRNVSR